MKIEKSRQATKIRPKTDCGSHCEIFIPKFTLKLKKIGEITRPFTYHLNQITYDFTVEVTNRFKGPDLIERVSDELYTEVHDIVQEAVIKTISKKKKCKKTKWLSEEVLQTAMKRCKRLRRKGKIYPSKGKVPKSSKER